MGYVHQAWLTDPNEMEHFAEIMMQKVKERKGWSRGGTL